MNSDHSQTLESNIPRRGRPRKNLVGSPPKSKSNLGPALSGVRKSKPRAVKLVLPNVQTAVQNLAKVANKSSEIVKTFPIAPAKDSTPITTFLLTPAEGKTGTLASVSKSGSLPMTLVQHVTSSGPTSIKQLPVAVSSTIFPRVQVSNTIGSTPKLLLITTASNSAASVPITSTNQTLCKTLLPVKLGNNTSTSGSVVAGNLGKQVLYKIPSSQSSGMVLLSTTTPSQSGGMQKKFLLIPSSTTTKRQTNAAVILNSKISQSVNPNSDKSLIAITSPTQTTCISTPNDSSKIPTTIVPISSLQETTSKKLTRQSAVNSSSPTKPVNTSRRRGSVLGANSTISSIPSGIFKTVACTTNSRGICSTPVSVQTSKKQSNVKLTQVSGLASHGPLITEPVQQMCVLTPDASLNMTIPTVPQASLNTNPSTSNPHCRMSPLNISSPSQIQCQSDIKPNASSESMPVKRSRPLPGHRAKKTIFKTDGGTPSFITVPSSLPFSAIQLKPNCSKAALSTSSFSGLSWLVSPNTRYQQKSSPNSETNSPNTSAKHKNIPKLIVVNGVSNGSFPTTQSASSQTSNNDCKTHVFSANQYSQCSQNLRPIYASPPKLTIAPGFSLTDKKGSESEKKKRPSELMIIKEREEFIDDSQEKSNFDDLSPPKLQREDGPDLNGPFNFEMPSQEPSFSSSYLAKLTSTAQTQLSSESYNLKNPLLSSSSLMRNQYQTFCQDIKPMVRKDNFPTLASLSAMNNKCSEFISRLDQNKKISFGQLFNHFKLLADNKKSKNASAIMFQVAHSIHCCVVLATIDIEGSVDLNNLPLCVEESMKCSVKCRRTFMKELFAEKAISSLLDPRFSLSILKSPDSIGERSSRCHRSRGPTNSSSANEDVSFSSNVTSTLSNIKTKLPDDDDDDDDDDNDDEYPSDHHQQQILTNSHHNPNSRKTTTGLTSEASTQKSATDESFSSCISCSTGSDCKCLMQCIQNPSLESMSSKQFLYSAVPEKCKVSSSYKNSCPKGKKKGKFCNNKCKKAESACSSRRNTSYKIKNSCNNTSELSSLLKVSPRSSTPQEFQLPGKLRYKIVPKGHISLSGKHNNSQEKASNSMNRPAQQSKIPVQSYIISGDKSTINPIRTISPILTHPTELNKDKTKNLTKSRLVRKRKSEQSSLQETSRKNLPSKKLCMSKTKDTPPRKKTTSPTKSPKQSCSKSSASTKLSVPLPETPLSMRDPKHLYDEPTTVDRVVMLTPDGKPILTDTDLKITFDDSVNCLTTPKKKGRLSKGKSPIKSLEKKCSILKKPSAKSPTKGTHSKSSTANKQSQTSPKLNFLLQEMDHKSKHKYLSSSSSTLRKVNSTKTNESTFYKTDKSKKANIENIISNITSGFPAFGPGSSRCTMKLYKYFVSTRIKNRARKNGSHMIDAPLTLYINWKTLSRQPFKKHRITNHALNVMAIKKAKQFFNYKKCKVRSKKQKPVKNRRIFLAKCKPLLHISKSQAKTNSNKSTKKKYYKKKNKSQSSKTKKYIKKTSSSSKKKAQALLLPCPAKTKKKKVMKTAKTLNNPELASIVQKGNSELLVNNNNTKKNKTLKLAHKNLIVKKRKQLNKKKTTKKAVHFTHCSSLPALRTTRSRVALPENPDTDSKKLDSLCAVVNQIKTESTEIKTPDTRTTKLNQQEMLNEQTCSNESPPVEPIRTIEDEDLPSPNKFEVADLIKKEEKLPTAMDSKQGVPNSQHELQENNGSNISPCEIATNPIPSHSTDVKTVAIQNQIHHGQQKLISSTKTRHSKTLAHPANAPQLPVSEKEDTRIEVPIPVISVASASNPADENAEVVTKQQLASLTVIEDSGNFIFEDDTESSLPVKNMSVGSCSQDKQLNSMHSNSSAENNQSVISNTNSNTPFTNIIPTIRSSAFSDKLDIGLSPQLARIQQLKDQLQEKQKALDLAKLYLK